MVYTTPLTYASGPYTAGMTLATVDGTTLYASGIGLIENPNNLPNYTYLYQCADFCKNYYRDVYGITFSGWGAAGTWKTTYDSSKFNFYANGGNIPPRIGDILTMSGPYNTDQSVGLGHVGIITEVSNSEIKLANQNGGTGTLKPIGWTIVRNPGNNLVNPGKYKIEGWIRKKP
jgi:surface antigen